jgi:Ca2+-transporting ATPase
VDHERVRFAIASAPLAVCDVLERVTERDGRLRQPPIDLLTISGLSEAEAARRLAEEGANELPSERHRSLAAAALGVASEPMFLLLLATGGLYLLLGDLREGLTLLSFVVVVLGITLRQERRTENALRALRDLSSPRALVIRGGEERRVAGREVVRGDAIVLTEGDRVPADALLRSGFGLHVDESLLTGESVPVRKRALASGEGAPTQPGGDDLPFVWSGTLVVSGRGVAETRAIGADTALGRIGRALGAVSAEATPLEREIGRIVRRIASAGLALCVLLAVVYGATRGDWLRGLLAGLTLAMAVVPEEFPVVLTVFFALGAWRLSKHRVLTRRVSAVEALGATTVLCVDKTGTLTENRMTIARLSADSVRLSVSADATSSLPESVHRLVEFGILASQRDPFDPMERAFHTLGHAALEDTEHLHRDWSLLREYPLSPELLALSHVWRSPEGGRRVIAAKGAPEAIADLCHLDSEAWEQLRAEVEAMASQGLRVLAVARASFAEARLPELQHDFDFELLGLVGLADPVRAAVPEAIAECRRAGLRVLMITGDHPETARSIGRSIGLPADEILLGPELERLTAEALGRRLRQVSIVARAVPEQKLRIIAALAAEGEVVAMTGDGVNDAPALKAAGIGIAMGARGTDVAREAADLVLTDDDFTSIVGAVRLGRRVFDNLRKAVAYILAIHVPIVGMSLLPVLWGWPLILVPVHIAFLQLVIDPACSIVFEAEGAEAGIMARPPRSAKEDLFSFRLVAWSVLQGLSVLAATFGLFAWGFTRGGENAEEHARALAFTTLFSGNLALIVTNRSWEQPLLATLRRPNAPQGWVLGVSASVLALVFAWPLARDTFHVALLPPREAALAVACGVLCLAWFEILKWLRPGWLLRPNRATAEARYPKIDP